MASLLEVVITFVGAILVLALVAQSLQEVIKSSAAIKSGLRFKAVKQLIIESAKAVGLSEDDGNDIVKQVLERLTALGQKAYRKTKAARLDVIDAAKLEELIIAAKPGEVKSLKGIADKPEGKAQLALVGAQATKWFELSVNAVTDRYRRRMQVGAIIAGAVVVLAVNADAFWILRQARNDPAFRAAVAVQAESLSTANALVRALDDSLAQDTTASDSVWEALTARRDSAVAQRQSASFAAVSGARALFPGYGQPWKFTLEWVLGILISALLVGLGAPFWHDLLTALVGLKDRVRAQAKKAQEDAGVT